MFPPLQRYRDYRLLEDLLYTARQALNHDQGALFFSKEWPQLPEFIKAHESWLRDLWIELELEEEEPWMPACFRVEEWQQEEFYIEPWAELLDAIDLMMERLATQASTPVASGVEWNDLSDLEKDVLLTLGEEGGGLSAKELHAAMERHRRFYSSTAVTKILVKLKNRRKFLKGGRGRGYSTVALPRGAPSTLRSPLSSDPAEGN